MPRKPAEIEPIEHVPPPAEPSNPDAPAPLEPLETDDPPPDGTVLFQDAAAPESPLSSLGKDELQALCKDLNAQIIVLHGEGKHEEGDALRVKHLNAIAALKAKSNPLGYA